MFVWLGMTYLVCHWFNADFFNIKHFNVSLVIAIPCTLLVCLHLFLFVYEERKSVYVSCIQLINWVSLSLFLSLFQPMHVCFYMYIHMCVSKYAIQLAISYSLCPNNHYFVFNFINFKTTKNKVNCREIWTQIIFCMGFETINYV